MGKRSLTLLLCVLAGGVFAKDVSQVARVVPPVILTAKKPKHASLTSGPSNAVSAQQLTASGATSLAQALQSVGGVQLQDITGNGSQVLLSMRGFGANASSNTLLLINGIPITHPDLAPPDLNVLPINDIESIEIISGSESVLYGDQAVGGVINLFTRDFTQEHYALDCGIGSYHAYQCSAYLHHTFNALNFAIGISHSHTDNYREHNDYQQSHVGGNLTYPLAVGHLKFNFAIANELLQYPGALTLQQVRQNRRQATNATDYFSDGNGSFQLEAKNNLSPDWEIKTAASLNKMQGHGVLTTPFTQSRMTYYLKPELQGHLEQLLTTSGIEIQNDNYHLSSLFGLTNESQQKYSLFSLVNIPYTSYVTFSLGARGAQQNSHLISITSNQAVNRALATTLGATLHLTDATRFYLRRAGSFRFPKADENASTPPNVHGLRTQRGIAYETGIEGERGACTGKIGIYQLNLVDEIAFDPLQTPAQPFGVNRNLDPTVRRGLSVSGSVSPSAKLSIGGQWNAVRAVFQSGVDANKRIPLVSQSILNSHLNYHFNDQWSLYSEAIFTGNQYPANDNANATSRQGGYTIYNLALHYRIKQVTASLRLNNLFNKDYYLYTVYQPSLPNEFYYPAPERNISLNLQWALA